MSITFPQRLSVLLGLSVLSVVGSGLSAQAQTIDTINTKTLAQPALYNTQPAPIPGTTITSSAALSQPKSAVGQSAGAKKTVDSEVAQIDVTPGIPTRGGSSYVGIAGNIGLDGETALGDSSFAVISKIGFTNSISARPSVLIGDDTTFLIPITYDFSILPTDAFDETFPIAPYVGAGIAIPTGDDNDDDSGSDVGFLLTGGVDYPISPQFTATAAVNATISDETDIGVLIGVGYNFTGFQLRRINSGASTQNYDDS